MSILYTETLSDVDSRTEIDLGDHRHLTINITHEGIIMDVFLSERTDESDLTGFDKPMLLGTMGMMFDEWADWIVADES